MWQWHGGALMYQNNIMGFRQAASALHHVAGKMREGGTS